MMYLRFVLPKTNANPGIKDGILAAAYAVQAKGDLSTYDRDELDALLRWFADDLKKPTRFNRWRSKGWYRRNTKGVCWLKPAAVVHVGKMHRLAGHSAEPRPPCLDDKDHLPRLRGLRGRPADRGGAVQRPACTILTTVTIPTCCPAHQKVRLF